MNEGIGEPDIMCWNSKTKPLFWMCDQTRMMKHIVEKFFEEIHLTNLEMKYLRWYIVQWIDGIVSHAKMRYPEKDFKEYLKNGVPENYKNKTDEMDQEQLMDFVVKELLNYGIDPF